MMRKKVFFLLWMLLSASVWSQTADLRASDSTGNLVDITIGDSQGEVANYWYYFPENRFVDSLRVDSLAKRFAVGLQLQFPTEKAFRVRDKYDPFLHEIYFRKARGKTWFFAVAVIVLLYFIYYRAVFQRQFELRISSLFRPYFFEDLMREQQISSAAGSVHAFVIGLVVFVLGVMLYLINMDFNKLNSFLMFLLVLFAWTGLSLLLYLFQWMFTFSLKIDAFLSRNLQRQINVNLSVGLILLPLFLIAYYNGTEWQEQWVLRNMYYVLIAWISLRLWVQLLGIIRDGMLNLTSILYFCTLEIIPYLLLIKFLQNSL
jgi:hypothetical protein